jgi:hypothetical protein
MISKSCILIQANGNNERLGKFFSLPKHELYYNNKKIIEHIFDNCEKTGLDTYLCIKEDAKVGFNPRNHKIIKCKPTKNRIDTLDQCFHFFKKYDSVLILDSDVLINYNVLKHLNGDSIAVGIYKNDGKKYGFVNLDPLFKFISGNEKTKEHSHITIGAYSVNTKSFIEYLNAKKGRENESLLNYYNLRSPNIVFSDSHICMGDINTYMDSIWS